MPPKTSKLHRHVMQPPEKVHHVLHGLFHLPHCHFFHYYMTAEFSSFAILAPEMRSSPTALLRFLPPPKIKLQNDMVLYYSQLKFWWRYSHSKQVGLSSILKLQIDLGSHVPNAGFFLKAMLKVFLPGELEWSIYQPRLHGYKSHPKGRPLQRCAVIYLTCQEGISPELYFLNVFTFSLELLLCLNFHWLPLAKPLPHAQCGGPGTSLPFLGAVTEGTGIWKVFSISEELGSVLLWWGEKKKNIG